MEELDHRGYWERGFTWAAYLRGEVRMLRPLWEGVASRVQVPEWALERAAAAGGEWRLLAISEDWCGDASNTLPVIAALAEASPTLELRVVKRDDNPELMDRYLTDGARSIPLVVVLDGGSRPRGRWGPRPAELQEFMLREKRAGQRPPGDIYRDARAWYARDRGETTLRELLAVVEAAAGAPRG
ncbi:MAG TPA: thioredoxin family protein [Longimicrobiaceae bacterium]|nr:thioredoxin family protein [Longimicrobiaceae bacterium]